MTSTVNIRHKTLGMFYFENRKHTRAEKNGNTGFSVWLGSTIISRKLNVRS